MSSSGFQQKTAKQRSLEGCKIVSYDDVGINRRSNPPFHSFFFSTSLTPFVPFARPELFLEEQRNYEYSIGPRDNSGHEEGCVDHQDRAWYYGEGEHEEERLERKYRSAFHGYVDLDKPAEKKSTK
jgi:hypothetical protein